MGESKLRVTGELAVVMSCLHWGKIARLDAAAVAAGMGDTIRHKEQQQ